MAIDYTKFKNQVDMLKVDSVNTYSYIDINEIDFSNSTDSFLNDLRNKLNKEIRKRKGDR